MSDEAERVRATLRVLDVLEFNGVPAAVVTADAVKALASLESQNQALQEEKDRWEARAKRPTAVAIADLDERIAALQEALKEAAMTVHLKHPHAGLTIGPFDSCEHALCTRFRAALSPTQETDPG